MKKIILISCIIWGAIGLCSATHAADGGSFTTQGVICLDPLETRVYLPVVSPVSVPVDAVFELVTGEHTAPYEGIKVSFGVSSLLYVVVSQNFILRHFEGDVVRPLFWKFEYNLSEGICINYQTNISWLSESTVPQVELKDAIQELQKENADLESIIQTLKVLTNS